MKFFTFILFVSTVWIIFEALIFTANLFSCLRNFTQHHNDWIVLVFIELRFYVQNTLSQSTKCQKKYFYFTIWPNQLSNHDWVQLSWISKPYEPKIMITQFYVNIFGWTTNVRLTTLTVNQGPVILISNFLFAIYDSWS